MGWSSWAYALGHDIAVRAADRRGPVRRHRDALVADLTGEVLDLGVGAGLHLPCYRRAGHVTAIEPDPDLRARAVRAAVDATVPVTVAAANAGALPFADDRFDHVVSTLVLCAVPDVQRVLREVRRVLRPGGSMHLYEHVRSDDPRLGAWQRRLRGPWAVVARGCRADQDTATELRRAGFDADLERRDLVHGLPLLRPRVLGRATVVQVAGQPA